MRPFRRKKKLNKKANYAFIDSQNLNLGTQKMGWKMDWKKFREWLRTEYNVEKAFMFIGYMPDYEKMYDQLHSQGYLVVLKPTLEMYHVDDIETNVDHSDASNDKKDDKKVVKGNIDADLVLHVMTEYSNYNQAIIVSGDGDFYSLVEYLDQHKKIKSLLTPNWQYSSLLKPYEKYIVRLDQKKSELKYYETKYSRSTNKEIINSKKSKNNHSKAKYKKTDKVKKK